ncbi:hypothetical protein IV203_028369 [Nitzschia inconspicua]|uniref:Uncharacterized protein n=1 Tax=Nitzschia inconspicua TaxID=303405 RepID=A0A9K3Q266_9STRA|nr:hypothetical protein IV203_011257 [Nitzschia inconspicua]KAG7365699.1 hypothetical protein IV203_028369 [Nitzschia inconspicua]
MPRDNLLCLPYRSMDPYTEPTGGYVVVVHKQKPFRNGIVQIGTRRDETRRDETRRDETRRDETRRDETMKHGKLNHTNLVTCLSPLCLSPKAKNGF